MRSVLNVATGEWRALVEYDMFRTHLLDEAVQDALEDLHNGMDRLYDHERPMPHSPRGRDTPWLTFLKRYLVHRVLTRTGITPECPETLLHRAAARLAELLGETSEDAVGRHMALVCQVAFWDRFCPYRFHIAAASPDTYICSPFKPAYHNQGDASLKELLLGAAIHLRNVQLANKLYSMDPGRLRDMELCKEIYAVQPTDLRGMLDAIEQREEGRVSCAASYGGREMFLLVNAREFGLESEIHVRREYGADALMECVLQASARGGDVELVHLLLDAVEPWQVNEPRAWYHRMLRGALVQASTPEILERLVRLAGPGFSLRDSTNHVLADGNACSWATPMAGRLEHHAATGNTAMVQYLIDQHGGAAFLNNPDRASLPAHPTTQTAADDLRGEGWLRPSSRSPRPRSKRHRAGHRPLLRAVEAGADDTVALLLDRGADPNAHPVGVTPLAEAVRRCNLRVARLLLLGGADPNLGTPPPVALAVAAEDTAMLALLLDAGAVVDTPEAGGWAVALARRDGLESMLDVLEGLGVERDAAWHHVPSLEEFILGEKYFGRV